MKYWNNGFRLNPKDGDVEITDEYWSELLDKQSQGYQIISDDNGYPIAHKAEKTTEQIEAQKKAKIQSEFQKQTDPLFLELMEDNFESLPSEMQSILQVWIDKKNEIREMED